MRSVLRYVVFGFFWLVDRMLIIYFFQWGVIKRVTVLQTLPLKTQKESTTSVPNQQERLYALHLGNGAPQGSVSLEVSKPDFLFPFLSTRSSITLHTHHIRSLLNDLFVYKYSHGVHLHPANFCSPPTST